ncbi:MAG: SMC-Scp complex subunit ScpB [Gemmataceae bacterium]|nr:SMC-Scp complex subunit ScpB [Gemmataceae bacterium]
MNRRWGRRPLGVATRRGASEWPGNHPLPWAFRIVSERTLTLGPLQRDPELARVEAALFTADEPLSPRKLARAVGLRDVSQVIRLVQRLREMYDADGTAFQVEEIAGGYQLRSRPQYHPWLARWRRIHTEPRLSPAALETLAIIAYRQPIMRADIEAIRGVQCGEILRQLMEKGLVRIVGRDDSLGRPVLYGTTRKFLQTFGLNSLADLPEIEQLRPPKKDE